MIKLGKFSAFVVTSAVLLAFIAVGFYFGRQQSQHAQWQQLFDSPAFAGSPLANLPLDSAARGKSLSLATGMLNPDAGDALYALDHLTGQLHCWVIDPRTGRVAASGTVNAAAALQITDGDADYVLTTGVRKSYNVDNNTRSANSLVYVGEGNSGRVATFAMTYNNRAVNAGQGVLTIQPVAPNVYVRNPSAMRDQR